MKYLYHNNVTIKLADPRWQAEQCSHCVNHFRSFQVVNNNRQTHLAKSEEMFINVSEE